MSPLHTQTAFVRPTLAALTELARDPGMPRVSIALPLEPSPPQAAQNAPRLRQAVAKAQAELGNGGFDASASAEVARSLDRLELDLGRIEGPARGAMVLARPGALAAFSLREAPAPLVHVGRALRVRPLLDELGRNDRFRVLALSMKRVALYEADPHGMRRVEVPDLPASLEDALGFEIEREGPSLRSGGPSGRGVVRIGHGSRSDERQVDLERFHRVVVRALEKVAANGPPIVLAADRTHQGEFRRAFQHPALLAAGVEGSFDKVDDKDLFARALEVARRGQAERDRQDLAELEALRHQGRTLDELTGIANAAIAGRVRKLWMRRGTQVPGLLDPAKLEVVQDPKEELLDSIALRSLMNGAEVHVVDDAHLPASPACALLR